MEIRLLVFFSLLFSSLSAFALERTPYITEAGKEIAYYFAFLKSDKDFVASLNPTEASQFSGIVQVTQALASQGGPQFKFSNNPQDFILNPGEPERSAKTTEILSDPVFINLRKLNSPEETVTYLDVIQLLVHELGHKLGKNEVQTAVDSLAAKMIQRLSGYSRKEHVFMYPAFERPREMREYFESVSLPKLIKSSNPEPSIFYIDNNGPKKIVLYLKKHLAETDENKVVQINRVLGTLLQGVIAEVRFSILKPLKTSQGNVLAHENSYKLREKIFPEGSFKIDGNFQVGPPRWIRGSSNYDFQVLGVSELSHSAQDIKWTVEFTGKVNPQKIYLLAGTEDNNSPLPCKLLSSSDYSSVAQCTYKIPSVTSISILDIFQLMVDDEVADLPELIQVDLEMDFKVRFVLSDMRPLKFTPYERQGQKIYDLTVTSVYPLTTVLVRCKEEQNYVINGRSEGFIQKTVEQIFLSSELPIKAREKNQWTFAVSCQSENAEISEILVTDETGYTMSPRWK